MNHDENNPDLQAWIEPEVEARLVAWVLGEASAFEAAEMERLIGEKPELAIFKRRIEAVHGLVGLALRPEQAPMRLAPERRAKILQTIGAPEARPPAGKPEGTVIAQLAATRRKQHRAWVWRLGIAACLTLGAILTVSTIPSFNLVHSLRLGPEENREVAAFKLSMPRLEQSESEAAPSLAAPHGFLLRNEDTGQDMRKRAEEAALRKDRVAQAPRVASDRAPRAPSFSGARQLGMASVDVASRSSAQDRVSAPMAPPADWAKPPRPEPMATIMDAGTLSVGNNAFTGSAPSGSYSSFGGGGGAGGKGAVSGQGFTGFGSNANAGIRTAGGLVGGSNRAWSAGANAEMGLATTTTVNGTGTGVQLVAGAGDNFAYVKPAGSPVDAQESKKSDDEVVALSPFEIASPKSQGYFAANTLAGTRLNSKLSDIASSISIVTKQQLADMGSAAANEVSSRVEPVTEGARQSQTLKPTDLPTSPAAIDEHLSKEMDAAKSEAAKAPQPPPPEPTRVELSTAKEPVSTFSLHVSDVSFRLAQAALARGEKPDPASIRPEEFYNAFDYGDPTPTTAEKISCHIEQSAHPMLQQRNLVRIAMKVPATGRGAGQPLHLTVLLDTSGSMEREDRVASVRRALEVLASLLGANDRVTLIGFAQQPRLLAEQLPGDQAAKLAEIAASTPFTGGTNMEEALKLAGELARRHRDPAAQNRIVLLTDGAANLGDADPAQLGKMIEAFRQQGLAFDACGVGTDGLDDAMLEALTRKGDGRYYVLDKPEDADAGFARQLAGAFRPAAENVKVQVRFNPARVGRYRLIGFEQHRLREEDFRNDKVDAAELAAEEAAVAVYQVEVLPQGEGELGEVFVRFRDAATGDMVERSWTMLHDPHAPVFSRATPTMQLAGTAALLAEKLGGGETADLVDLAELAPVVNGLRGHFANDRRVQELVTMFEQLRRMNGK